MTKRMRLMDLIDVLDEASVKGDRDMEVNGITYDSRKTKPGDLFVCIKGFRDDGHRYAQEARRRGAVALVIEEEVQGVEGIPLIFVPNARNALALLADRFYGSPSTKLCLIGVTGTEGKTTTTYLIEAILRAAGLKVGLIGSIVNRIREEREATLTTPESLDLQQLLHEAVEAWIEHVVMEVSSHALTLNRVTQCEFDVRVFTNLNSDHLDLHGDFQSYLKAKATLFSILRKGPPSKRFANILNWDDPHSREILREFPRSTPYKLLTYGLNRGAHVMGRSISSSLRGLSFTVITQAGTFDVSLKLTGDFNVYNALAATAVSLALGIDLPIIKRGLESVEVIPGRFEVVEEGQDFLVIVDFAHTPNALEKLLTNVRDLVPGRLITVFGCPGERDPNKRPVMGELAARLSDYVIVTNDNPASEDPSRIAQEVEEGICRVHQAIARYEVVLDRNAAVFKAFAIARNGDAVVLAGKGHEKYQILREELVPYSDRETAVQLLRAMKRNV